MVKNDKQKLLIEYLVSSKDTYAVCKTIIQSKYFDVELRKVVDFIDHYYEEYHTTPGTDQIKAETGIELSLRDITSDRLAYATNEIETFCKRKAIEHAVIEGAALIDEGDYGKIETLIKDAVAVSLQRDLGIEYF